MISSDNFDDGAQETHDANSKDIWYKLRSVGGIATALVVALIGTVSSLVINHQQSLSTRAQLFTELMSQREDTESDLRKDMFQQIFFSFLTTSPESECTLDEIDKDLLQLELLSRNFHEMLDLEPLFLHVLRKIVHENHANLKDSSDNCIKERYEMLKSSKRWKDNPEVFEKKWGDEKAYKKNMLRKRIERLNKIAKRISRKQMEGLACVEQRYRMTIDLSKTCQETRPSEVLPTKWNKQTGGCVEKFTLQLKNLPKREFKLTVKHSYPRWNQIRVNVEVEKTIDEKKADQNGEDAHIAEFWLSYFDFPLAENTLLSSKERYAVVLDEIDEDNNTAKISLLYFPASYASLKEKSFYQQQLMSTLLEENNF